MALFLNSPNDVDQSLRAGKILSLTPVILMSHPSLTPSTIQSLRPGPCCPISIITELVLKLLLLFNLQFAYLVQLLKTDIKTCEC